MKNHIKANISLLVPLCIKIALFYLLLQRLKSDDICKGEYKSIENAFCDKHYWWVWKFRPRVGLKNENLSSRAPTRPVSDSDSKPQNSDKILTTFYWKFWLYSNQILENSDY